jgi:hypothetical protein
MLSAKNLLFGYFPPPSINEATTLPCAKNLPFVKAGTEDTAAAKSERLHQCLHRIAKSGDIGRGNARIWQSEPSTIEGYEFAKRLCNSPVEKGAFRFGGELCDSQRTTRISTDGTDGARCYPCNP